MTNLYEIKARAAQLNHPHPTYFSYHAQWAATTILELCDSLAEKDAEIERLKAEILLKEKMFLSLIYS